MALGLGSSCLIAAVGAPISRWLPAQKYLLEKDHCRLEVWTALFKMVGDEVQNFLPCVSFIAVSNATKRFALKYRE